MVVLGLEKGFTAAVQPVQKSIEKRAQFKYRNLVQTHFATHSREPSEEELLNYQKRAIELIQMETKLQEFFKKENFKISTKELLFFIQNSEDLKPLLKKMETTNAQHRNEVPQYLTEIKTLAEQNIFQSMIMQSTIITNKDKENLRNVFMQERSFEWIKVNTDYLKDVNSNIENEAEIQEAYQNGSFSSEPSAKIKYIEIDANKIKKPIISDQKIKQLIANKKIQSKTNTKYHIIEYQLTDKTTKESIDLSNTKDQIHNIESLRKSHNQDKIHYTKRKKTILDDKIAIDKNINSLNINQYMYDDETNKLYFLNKIEETQCLSKECINGAKRKWQEREMKSQLNTIASRIQEEKLYAPKDLTRIAKEINLKIKELKTITPSSNLKETLNSQYLKEHIFENADNNKISSPIKLDNGNIIFYQIGEYTPSKKKDLQAVREEIIKELKTTQMKKQLDNEIKLSVKKLHNGEKIEILEKKFKTSRQKAGSFKELKDKVPAQIVQAASQIPSTDIGWAKPILQYNQEDKHYYLLTLKDVIYTDKNSTSVNNIISDEAITQILQSQEINSIYQEILK
ncbi:MAG: hypothetical protein VX737_05880 [Pseudomonadota bacterium]|nr:hypothetical protein [Pseudomonadota bacterium]